MDSFSFVIYLRLLTTSQNKGVSHSSQLFVNETQLIKFTFVRVWPVTISLETRGSRLQERG